MWDYDKLFADGNIIGIKNCYRDKVFNNAVDITTGVTWLEGYKNEELSCKNQYVDVDDKIKHGYTTDFKIQYIIRLDEHGNVAERLFDREHDMPKPMPELETGMFVRVIDNGNMDYTVLGYVDIQNCRIIYQDGKYNDMVNMEKLKGIVDIVEVYSIKTLCFNRCFSNENLIWRSPEYQAYLDSKN